MFGPERGESLRHDSPPVLSGNLWRQALLLVTGALVTASLLIFMTRQAAMAVPGAPVAQATLQEVSPAPAATSRSLLAAHLEELQPSTMVTAESGSRSLNRYPLSASGRTRSDADAAGPRVIEYEVRPGDTLWEIAQRYEIDEATLRNVNPDLNPAALQPGQTIRVLTVQGTLHTVQPGEAVQTIADRYRVTTGSIAEANGLSDIHTIRVGQELIVPGATVPAPATGRARSAPVAAGWMWPLSGPVTSHFGPRWGKMHSGIDIAAPTGTPVAAARAGTVAYANWDGGYGLSVIIDHGDGTLSRYAHASTILVNPGECVDRGDAVIRVGSTGFSTGPHLHFEIIAGDEALDPLAYLP